MDKDRKFPGQPLLSQILNVIPASIIKKAVLKHNSNRYYKKLPLRVHLTSLLYSVFSYCNGLREICEGMLGCEGKLGHLGLDKAPSSRSVINGRDKKEIGYQEVICQYDHSHTTSFNELYRFDEFY